MKSTIKIANLRSLSDINNIREAISNNEGVIACQINKEKSEVNVVYDSHLINEDKLVQSLEDLGYTIL
ncbi:heavy-metal-associated domain-containing protein [Candidatus Clostridium radicumherbarum]|jgi:Copper chaperone|uniref:Heavy-metal-associated domain-containing protein n=1 Tax=Candidatus Clostridium radicumherbarum TaxID=3381662 RepID=A0ABW8TZZ4_9CLOT